MKPAPKTRRGALISACAILASVLCACSPTTGDHGSAATESAAVSASSTGAAPSPSEWPRTVTIGGKEVTIAAQPKRIVALSTETADAVLQLVGPERVVAVPKSATDPASANQVERAKQVETVLTTGIHPDPEQILSLTPDLVVMTGRHEGEKDTAALLATSGVPTITFQSSDFATTDSVRRSILALGQSLGESAEAEKLVASFDEKVAAVESKVRGVEERPSAIVLFQRGGKTRIFAQTATPVNILEQAGGESLAREEGWASAVPADPETIIRLNPDVIVLQDFHGQGAHPYDALLKQPALADVSAIRNNRVIPIEARILSGTSGLHLADGLDALARELHPDRFVSGA